MTHIDMHVFYQQVFELIDTLEKQEMDHLIESSRLCALAIRSDSELKPPVVPVPWCRFI